MAIKSLRNTLTILLVLIPGCSTQTKSSVDLTTPIPKITKTLEATPVATFTEPAEAVYDKNYMVECRKIFPTVLDQPATYKSLQSWNSTQADLEDTFLGQLLENSIIGIQHIYYDPVAKYTRILISVMD